MNSDLIQVFDGHSDSLLEWYFLNSGSMAPFLHRQDRLHVDLVRGRRAGLVGGICAICIPPTPSEHESLRSKKVLTATGYVIPLPEPLNPEYAAQFGLSAIHAILSLEQASGGDIRLVRSSDDLDAIGRDHAFWVVMHLEGAESVAPDLSNLDQIYELGVRSIGPVWSRPNVFGHGVPFAFPSSPNTGPGLTDAGIGLVRECNSRGILVDLSHIAERGFWEVAALTDKPLVVSHAGAHVLCPSARNLTDQQLDAIGDSDGLVGVTFHVADLRADGDLNPETPLDRIVDHIVYIADRIGVEHVALGSDFDGATIPASMNDVSGLPILINRLTARGFTASQCRSIARDNWLRVLKVVFGGSGI